MKKKCFEYKNKIEQLRKILFILVCWFRLYCNLRFFQGLSNDIVKSGIQILLWRQYNPILTNDLIAMCVEAVKTKYFYFLYTNPIAKYELIQIGSDGNA